MGLNLAALMLFFSCCWASDKGNKEGRILYADAIASWSKVLNNYVNDAGQVDFYGLSHYTADLKVFIKYISQTDLEVNVQSESKRSQFSTREAKLAYYINSYNALAMYNILDSEIPKSLTGFRKVSFFYLKRFSIGAKKMSLYTYENKIIRAMGDERVHFALNCMSMSCPRLRRVVFTEKNLDKELKLAAELFFSETRNLQVNHEKQTIVFSEIMEMYRDDFLKKASSLTAYANQYLQTLLPTGYQTEFVDYDWTVNRQRSGS